MRYYSEETIKDFLHYALPPFSEVSSSDIEDYPYIEIGDTQSNWHTGTPTEEGWYLVAYQHKDIITYYAVRFFLEKDLDMEFLDSEGGIYYPDIWKAVAWQKIEPYEASTCSKAR